MAKRPIFIADPGDPNPVREVSVKFDWHLGMAMSRRKMSMRSLHDAAQILRPGAKILEVSCMSDESVGERLSAFSLTLEHPDLDRAIPVECAFQASKVLERGGPYWDLLDARPADGKRDPRLQESGLLTGFRFRESEESWPTEPKTAFHEWIYLTALREHPDLASEVASYDIFTDIAFNPAKSFSCQAGAVALYVALDRRRELEEALSSREGFLEIVSQREQTEAGDSPLPLFDHRGDGAEPVP